VRLRFGDLTFDQESRELLREGKPLTLSPRCAELLALLIENRPRAVAREDLRRGLWPDGPPPNGSLASLVLELRGAIEAKGETETIGKTSSPEGYAFLSKATEDRRPLVAGAGYRFRLLWDDREIALAEGENVLGRDYDVEVRVDDAKVSRRHARITIDGDRAMLEDLDSSNGTFHNDRRLKEAAVLADGDRIQLGRVHLVFRSLAAGRR
jgi:DNA-binding winged helix-turn-helix (wHTH) protein